LHDAVCAECGNDCKVPFFPTGERPVYCSDCFEKRDSGDDRARAPRRSNFDRPNFSEKRNYSAPAASNRNQEDDSKKFDLLNAKLDKVLKTLNFMINKDKDAEPTETETSLPAMVSALENELIIEASPKAKTKKPRTKKVTE
jgi:CxxC-x17-CxxC domain-containing protein